MPVVSATGRVDAARLSEVAVYRRVIGAGIERIWENVLDWEHLPWLHATSFSGVDLLETRADGWRARVWMQPAERRLESVVETHLEIDQRRYLTITSQGVGAGTEIRTALEWRGATETAIEVRFLVPDLQPAQVAPVGSLYLGLYERLWDEDEAMMRRRQALLERRPRRGAAAPLSLGRLEEVRRRLPLIVEHGGRPVRIVEVSGRLLAHSTVCPHQLGPLDAASIENGCLRCPWHGYRFDVETGRCLDMPRLSLRSDIEIRLVNNQVFLSSGATSAKP